MAGVQGSIGLFFVVTGSFVIGPLATGAISAATVSAKKNGRLRSASAVFGRCVYGGLLSRFFRLGQVKGAFLAAAYQAT
ncbi:hypothetical protein GCM10027217_39620 [Pseudomaricurvus hydrocarbonicus]